MKFKVVLCMAVVGVTALSGVLAFRHEVQRDEAEWESFASRQIEDNLPLPFEIQRINNPSPFALVGRSIDASVTVPGGKTEVLASLEKHLRSAGWTVEKTEDSVGCQKGDLSLRLTHVAKDNYLFEETFAL